MLLPTPSEQRFAGPQVIVVHPFLEGMGGYLVEESCTSATNNGLGGMCRCHDSSFDVSIDSMEVTHPIIFCGRWQKIQDLFYGGEK